MRKNVFITFLIVSFFYFVSDRAYAQSSETTEIKQTIQQSISNWDENRFILYTAQGSTTSNFTEGDRTFLFDKTSGQCRFETMSNNKPIVVLFNFKSKKLNKYFENSKELSNTTGQIEPILDQFFEDTKLLFLPIFLSAPSTKFDDVQSKLVNSEKVYLSSFSNLSTFNENSLSGKVTLDLKGELKSFENNSNSFTISGNKDIGAGIYLPTKFQSKRGSTNIVFSTVAAFTDIENGKFTSL